jgi:transcriptional regulator
VPERAPFENFDDRDVRDLIAQYPLAWVVAVGAADGSLLPLLGEYDAEGRLVALIGHLARRNPLHARLVAAPAATILFTGPQAYISPDHAERRDWGPTWNYAQLVVEAEVTFEPDNSVRALDKLVQAMEQDRWTHEELGTRFDGMAAAIIAFRARVTRLSGRFKLGQDEPRSVFAAIVRNHPDAALVHWMERFARLDDD